MGTPQDYRILAADLRREAKKPGALARRAKLMMLAEQFEEIANDYEREIARRPQSVGSAV